jgi:competence protein ComEC
MNFSKIEKLGKAGGDPMSAAYSEILFVKQKLEQAVQNNFLPPHSLLLAGIIFGNNKNMTQDLRDKLNNTGLRFLTAISGVHVVILSAILINLLMFLKLKRNYAFLFSIILIWLYIVLTGFTTSGIRAGIMGSIFIFAGVLGRQNTSSRTIVLAGALMLLQNPLLLTYDVGFQLSFMACLGIIYLKPSINFLLKKVFKNNLRELVDIISVTLTAQIFTLPIMVFNFGTIPFISPITNILILPVMPAILSFGFLFAIFASLSKILGWIFYLPIYFLISYFLKVMEIFSQHWMVKTITNISWIWLLLFYLIIFSVTIFLNKKFKHEFL